MKLKLEIEMDNEAFEDGQVISKILRRAAKNVESEILYPGRSDAIFDINGNRVGEWKVTTKPTPRKESLKSKRKVCIVMEGHTWMVYYAERTYNRRRLVQSFHYTFRDHSPRPIESVRLWIAQQPNLELVETPPQNFTNPKTP